MHTRHLRPGHASLATAAVLASVGAAALVQYRAHAAEREHPPRGRFVSGGHGRLHYLTRGEGRPVVFLHGNGLMSEDFAACGLLDLVGRTSHAIAFDRPGFGYSARDWTRSWTAAAQAAHLLRAFEALGLQRPIVVGHSWATMVALEMALQRPEAIAGLVLVSGYYFPTLRADVALFSPPAMPVLGDLFRYTFAPILAEALKPRLIAKMFAPQAVPERFQAHFPQALITRPGQIRAEAEDAAHMIGSARALVPRYGEIRTPVAILAGTADGVVGLDQAERLHATISQSSCETLPGEGHMLHYSHPEKVMQAVHSIDAERA